MPTIPPSPDSTGEILAQAPCRADLAGSTLDIWPLYLFHEGAVTVNVAALTVEGIKAISATKTKAGLALVLLALTGWPVANAYYFSSLTRFASQSPATT